jgi:hypothetical protein
MSKRGSQSQSELPGLVEDSDSIMDTELPDLIETQAASSLLGQLLTDSRLYTKTKDYIELLDFVIRLRNFAPFNGMLLQVQKPGLGYAASAADWRARFKRTVKEGARPLLILRPFGPVALVYDVLDTEGKQLPPKVMSSFFAEGAMDEKRLAIFKGLLSKKGIDWCYVDTGDLKAGSIRVIKRPINETDLTLYRIQINRNHTHATQFGTLAHELGHLFLGHLGPDPRLNVPDRRKLSHAQDELEAESVAYLVCKRNGVTSKSESYLAKYVEQNTTTDCLDIYRVMRVAGQVEALLGLAAHTR